MEVITLGQGIASLEDYNLKKTDLNNRKSTKNMIMASSAIEKAISDFKERWEEVSDECGLFLSTSYGEFESSVHFYDGLVNKNRARPIFFQNSLHNSTLGKLSILFNLNNYCALLCGTEDNQEEQMIQMCKDYIEAGKISYALCVIVDSKVENYFEIEERYCTSSEKAKAIFLGKSSAL